MGLGRGRQALPEGHPGRAGEPPAPEPLIEGILDAGTVMCLARSAPASGSLLWTGRCRSRGRGSLRHRTPGGEPI